MVWSVSIDGSVREVLGLTFQTGSQRSANPQRPTGSWGSGRVSVKGYRTQTRKRLSIAVGGTDRVFGWAQNERYDDQTDISTYDIEGLLFVAARKKVMVAQTANGANANQSAVLNKLRDAFGLSAMQSSLASTPLGLYSFDGPAGGYASRFGLVAGGLPYATQKGLLGIKDPTRVPNSLDGTFGSRDYRIRDIVSNFDSAQLWNEAIVPFVDRGGVTQFSEQRTLRWTYANRAQASRSTTISLAPPPNDRTTYRNFTVSLAAERADTIDGARETNGATKSSTQPTFSNTIAYDSDTHVVTLRSSRSGTWPGTWSAFGSSVSAWSDGGNGVQEIRIIITATWERVTTDLQQNIDVSNAESGEVWGQRALEFPVWFDAGAATQVQQRIDALSEVRNLRTVDFYVDQRDTTKTNAVAAIEPGHYIALTDVGTIVYVMNVEWLLSSRNSAIKRVTCIDTGTDHTPTVPTNALTWRSDEVTWRTQYLEWSRA